MKLKIKQNIIMEHLNYVIKGISNKNLIPIYNCIKLELKDEGLYLLSTDSDIVIKTFIPKKDIEEVIELGEVVISGKYIYEIIRKLSGFINIEEVVDSKLFIFTDNSSFNLNCNPASDYPDIDLEGTKTPIILRKKVFKTIISEIAYAASTREDNIYTGINLKINQDNLECISTDSHRLALKRIKLTETIENSINIIIPTKNLNELIKLFKEEDGELELHIFNNKIIFKFDDIIFKTSLINGKYPDVSKLIPNEFSLTMTTNLNDYYDAIDRASLLTKESEKNTIKFESKNNKVIISSTIPEIGRVEETIEVNKDRNEEIKIAFNSKYMIDALRVLESENIQLLFNGDIKPIIIKTPDNESLIQLIVPIKTY
ncbi:MAG: DNA polymerase III subunit beta [Mycoplasmatota bacterium]